LIGLEAVPAFNLPSLPLEAASFESLVEAREALVFLAVDCMRASRARVTEYSMISRRLEQWTRAFDAFVVCRSATLEATAQRRGVALVRLQQRYLALKVGTANFEGVTGSSAGGVYAGPFSEMIEDAAIALGFDPAEEESWEKQLEPVKTRFHMDIGAIPILFSISARWRDPKIRRKAIALMRNASIQDGLWPSVLAAEVAERIMELEETEMSHRESLYSVSTEVRVRSIALTEIKEKGAVVQYGLYDSSRQEHISW